MRPVIPEEARTILLLAVGISAIEKGLEAGVPRRVSEEKEIVSEPNAVEFFIEVVFLSNLNTYLDYLN